LIILCCWIVSFFFNGIESGLLSIDPVRLRQNVKRGVAPALRLNRLLKQPERLLLTVLLFTNAADILGLLLLTRQLVHSFGYAGFFLALVIAVPVYLFLLSVLPKSLFRRFPFRALAAWPVFSNSCRSCSHLYWNSASDWGGSYCQGVPRNMPGFLPRARS